jgi:hypothetical protein
VIPNRRPVRRLGTSPSESFTCIPNDLARDGEIDSSARSIAMYLWSHQDGWKVSAKSIGDALDIDRRTVARALGALSDKRWIAVHKTAYFLNPARKLTEGEHAHLTECAEPVHEMYTPDDWPDAPVHGMSANLDMGCTEDLYTGCTHKKTSNNTNEKTSDPVFEQRQEAIARGECPQCQNSVGDAPFLGFCNESCFDEYATDLKSIDTTPVP